MFSEQQMTALSDDPELGAGNFLWKILELGQDHNDAVLLLDTPVILPSGVAAEFSRRSLAHAATSQAAFFLQSQVQPKDPVGLWFDDTVDYLINYLALTRIGAIPVFANGHLDPDVTVDFLRFVGCSTIVSRGERAQRLRTLLGAEGPKIVDADSILWPASIDVPAFRHCANDPVLIGHSSGTTGRPKAVQFNHFGFAFGVKVGLTRQVGRRVLTALPHSHASSISILMTAFLRGCTIRLQSQLAQQYLTAAIQDFGADLVCAFPKTFVDLCRGKLQPDMLSTVEYWLATGDANHETHIRQLLQHGRHREGSQWRSGSAFIDNLGTSELGFAMFRNVHRYTDGDRGYDRRIGRPFSWVDAVVLDERGEPSPPFSVGRLGIRSHTVTAGYWNNSLLTEKNRCNGYWVTGDLSYMDDEGVFYHVDRIGDSIDTGEGILYSCQTEEFILKNFEDVFDCSIVGVVPESGANLPVMTAEVSTKSDPTELLAAINAALSRKRWPRISQLKLEDAGVDTGVTGKKLKRVLRQRLGVDEGTNSAGEQ